MLLNQEGFNVFPLFVRPKEDELLSSWIVRTAHSHELKVQTFCKLFLKEKNVWNRNVNLIPFSPLHRLMAKGCDTTLQQVYETTLLSYRDNLSLQLTNKTRANWILASHLYHRIRKNYYLQFCPNCLKKDGDVPYYRKKWRLALSVVCPSCKIHLLDCCTVCAEPVMFYRSELGQKQEQPKKSINLCHYCEFDLSQAKQVPCNNQIIRYQSFLYQLLEMGYSDKHQYSHLYFEVLNHIISLFNTRNEKIGRLKNVTFKYLSFNYSIGRLGSLKNFEDQVLSTRYQLLYAACWLLSDWPSRFIKIADETNLGSSFLLRGFEAPPYWFYSVVKSNFFHKNDSAIF